MSEPFLRAVSVLSHVPVNSVERLEARRFLSATTEAFKTEGDDAVVADLDGDGLSDLVMRDIKSPRDSASGQSTGKRQHSPIWIVYLNDGRGGLVQKGTLDLPGAVWVAAGDVNGDGYADLVSHEVKSPRDSASGQATGKRSHLAVHINNGDADRDGQGDANFTPGKTFSFPHVLDSIHVGDVDGDGRAEITIDGGQASGKRQHKSISILDVDSGQIDEVARVRDSVDVVTGDFNGDGRLDLATFGPTGGGGAGGRIAIYTLAGDGKGGFGEPTLLPFLGPQVDLTGKEVRVAVGDLNGDGFADVVVSVAGGGSKSDVYVWKNVANGGGGGGGAVGRGLAGPLHLPGTTALGIAVGDVNGDGIPDLIAYGEGEVYVARVSKDPRTGELAVFGFEPQPIAATA